MNKRPGQNQEKQHTWADGPWFTVAVICTCVWVASFLALTTLWGIHLPSSNIAYAVVFGIMMVSSTGVANTYSIRSYLVSTDPSRTTAIGWAFFNMAVLLLFPLPFRGCARASFLRTAVLQA